jgi:hypothetical protein
MPIDLNITGEFKSNGVSAQPSLVSGTNIKTINGSSVLGSGDLVVGGASGPGPAKVYLFNDFINNNGGAASDTGINVATNGSAGLFSSPGIPNRTNQQGVVYFSVSNTNATIHHFGGQGATAQTVMFGAGGAWSYETSINIFTLSNLANRFRIVCGFGLTTSTFASDGTGVFFTYDEGATQNGTAASPNWQCVTTVSNVRTVTTTAVPVVISAWLKLRIEINATATSAAFFINGTLVATHTTNIPNTLSPFGVVQKTGIVKTTGTGSVGMYIDYILYESTLTTPR